MMHGYALDGEEAVATDSAFGVDLMPAPEHDSWVATLAHELRNPLWALMVALDLLQPACDSAPDVRQIWETAEHASQQMARVIDDVLDLCRSAHGKLTLYRERVDVAAAVAGAVAAVRPLLAARGHKLEVSLHPRVSFIESQASRLEQVITNLLTNAAKFTGPGGHITLRVEPTAHSSVAIRVSDDGIGIAPELLPHVFDAYRQGPAMRDPRHTGLGIGLTLVQSLVSLMGGTVSAYSDGPGAGAEFVVDLPMRCCEDKETTRPRR